tara:strand:- start:18128 stop:20146 length:2019 start_codon:yes stop_codon:yes gene_type:complete
MAYFKLNTFGGRAPRISPRLLGDSLAQTATDVNLESGRLVPLKTNSDALTLANSSKQSIYKYTDSPVRWLQFDGDVDVVRGPIAGDTNDTVYWTGDGAYPKMGRSSDIVGGSSYPNSSYRLGIPAPTAAPTVAVVAETSFDGIITTVDTSATITVTTYTSGSAAAHGASVGEYVTLTGFSATNGLTADNINGTYKIDTVPSDSTLTVILEAAATGAGNSSSVANGVKVGGTSDAQLDYETSYVYTFVSAYGEEGPPSPASTVITTDDNQSVAISGLEVATNSGGTLAGKTNVNFGSGAKKRIYRSNTGSATTAFQFVAEVAIATTSYTDTSKNSELAEVIPSTYWIGPPDDNTTLYADGAMKGLCALPGGIFAGFTGKRICFSEPFMPHAWPSSYRITLEEEIVAIEVVPNGVLATTKATPYLITGNDPSSMTAIRIESSEPCLSKRSMVDMGSYVLYASPDGLVAAAGAEARNVTEEIITPSQWQANYYPSTITGFFWENRYVGFYSTGSGYGGFVYDSTAGVNSFTDLDASALIRGGFTDPDDSQLYLIIANKIEKFQGGGSNLTYNWKSKEFVPPKPTGMGFLKVDAESYPVQVKVYADGSVIYDATISTSGSAYAVTGATPSFSATAITEPIVRLPAGVYSTFSVEVIGATTVNEICIGESIDELKVI